MTVSMTGYGRSSDRWEEGSVTVEIKTVNHRFCDIQFRMPHQLLSLEESLRKEINGVIERGKVDVFITMEGSAISVKRPQTNWNLLSDLLREAEEMEKLDAFDARLSLEAFLLHPDIVTIEEKADVNEKWHPLIVNTVRDAARQLYAMRVQEGVLLEEDMLSRIERVEKWTAFLQHKAPEVISAYQQRLEERVKDFLHGNYEADEARILTEVAVFADKTNIEEETTRLTSHCTQFRSILQDRGQKGRKLDFLVQEMNREMNTIGSKANNAEISHLVVDLKSELEKIKEQVQNIE
ncbi:YicC/YloC family endoribonuclease [Alteribacillus sp. HJP-4]|uniref:YicC/YloC family endoribonuclease n=1 Tax=Alteribacillus sp. HJP-4 TaxID=2775394 RepID=UPI0035CD09BC